MTKIYFFLTILTGLSAYGQSVYFLEKNNVSALISDGGTFFEDVTLGQAAYEVPIGSETKAIYSMGLWMAGQDGNAQLHSSYGTYWNSNELFTGPISDNYSSSYYTSTFLTSMWTMTKVEVDNHNSNYLNVGYTVPTSIANWPGNGNSSEGVSAILAPYVDVNSNGTYDPVNGDYPAIEGDEAVFVILNDENGAHSVASGLALGVEIHVMLYQFNTPGNLNNTTFFNVKAYNRRNETYADFKLGIFADFDLGDNQDDYFGSDSARNYMFVYNGDNFDATGGGNVGYGTAPPALGIVSLSHTLESAVSASNAFNSFEFYNVLNGLQANGAPIVHSSGFDTKFSYSGDPESGTAWNETVVSNAPTDQKAVMSIEPVLLAPGSSVCADFAIVYARDTTQTNLQNAQDLDSIVDDIQSYYNSNIQPCSLVNVGLSENSSLEISVYPIPSNGQINVNVAEAIQLSIYGLGGDMIYTTTHPAGNFSINLEGYSGMYILRAIGESGTYVQKIKLN
jgi:Secretion system C-terminal sorting domain